MILKKPKIYTAIGLMSGTSLDGIDVAVIRTDGEGNVEPIAHHLHPYHPRFKTTLKTLLAGEGDILSIEKTITEQHAKAVQLLLDKCKLSPKEIEVIGFHGQTIKHRPEEGLTWQLGNGSLLAELTGIDVISDFRRRDMAAGGQGAPLVPIYHRAITHEIAEPVAIINIGGVANITFIDRNKEMIAFDTGPGNALLDDWMYHHTGKHYDECGITAAKGKVDQAIIDSLLSHPYFTMPSPKSLDRHSFILEKIFGTIDNNSAASQSQPSSWDKIRHWWKKKGIPLSLEDGAATLAEFTIASITKSLDILPETPHTWFICGGGRHNHTFLNGLEHSLSGEVKLIDTLGYDGDALEAQAFAYLAIRSLQHKPLTFPTTTGAKLPQTGGAFYCA